MMVDIVCTIGPSSDNKETIIEMKNKGMDFGRINLSHTDLDFVKKMLPLFQELAIPLIIDTEGAQVRTGKLKNNILVLEEGDIINLHNQPIDGDNNNIHLWPVGVVNNLKLGDMVSIDFDALLLAVIDVSEIGKGHVKAKVINGGVMGKNKSVVVHDASGNKLELPVLSEKDKEVLDYSIKHGVKYVAASFMNSGEDVDYVRSFVGPDVKIFSKLESKKALNNLLAILKKSDYAWIDRGDLSKEIPIERIPLTQKIIIRNGLKTHTPVFVATNLLETMSEKRMPTRAEVNDIINTLLDGASGLALAGETATGKYPVECVKMLNKLITQSEIVTNLSPDIAEDKVVKRLEELNYLNGEMRGSLIEPHGGKLVNRMLKKPLDKDYLNSLFKIKVDDTAQMDIEQIAIGTFSPLEGFMCKEDFISVLNNMRLKNGVVWTIPIVLDIDEETKSKLSESQEIALVNNKNEIIATMKIDEIYSYDKVDAIKKLFGTDSDEHPGVKMFKTMKPYLVGGKITLIKRMESHFKEYELTPSQARKIFEEKGWSKIVGFHTRNVIHRSHEFIQNEAIKKENCDGLFVHPIIGRKKTGDFNTDYIIKSYEIMMDKYYPKGKVVFGAFSTFSRYAGPREAIFTAICRKNFGCSHFIVGRDHTGVKDFYNSRASHYIFDKFPDIGIKPIKFDNVFYSKKYGKHIHESEMPGHPEEDKLFISGTQIRNMLEKGEQPPEWAMRPEISNILLDALKKNKEVFVKNY